MGKSKEKESEVEVPRQSQVEWVVTYLCPNATHLDGSKGPDCVLWAEKMAGKKTSAGNTRYLGNETFFGHSIQKCETTVLAWKALVM